MKKIDDEEPFSDSIDFQPELETKIKRKTLVAPWKNIEEFHQVYDWLFAPNADDATRTQALSQMQIWSLRRSSLCPAAVLATIVLLEVHIKDAADDNHGITAQELQTLYASAFTRFFNYMSSIMQTHNMRTMYETAKQLGLPTFVVDLRHLCAHGQVLPPLEVLRLTSLHCYDWLHDHYWSEQRAVMSNVDANKIRRNDKTQFDDSVTQLFKLYDAALEAYCNGARDMKVAKRKLHGKRLTQLKEFMSQKSLTVLREVFDAVVKELASLVKREVGIKDLSEIYLEALLRMKFFSTVSEKHTSSAEDFQALIEVSQGLFRLLAIQGFIDELFVNLMEIAENTVVSDERRAGASFWALQIVKGFVAFRKCKQLYKAELDANPKMKECDFSTLNSDTISKQARKLLIYSGIDMKSTLIFGDSTRRPWVWIFERSFIEERVEAINPLTAPVIKCLLPLADPALTPSEMKAITDLIEVQYEQNPENLKMGSAQEKLYTVHDLHEKVGKIVSMDLDIAENDELSADGIQRYGIWSTVPVDETQDWSICPLGRVPWE